METHLLLRRQLAKIGLKDCDHPPTAKQWPLLLERISRTYSKAEQNRHRLRESLHSPSCEPDHEHDRAHSEIWVSAEINALQSAVNALGVGVCILDDTGSLTSINPEGARLLGWEESELLGSSFLERIDPLDVDESSQRELAPKLRHMVKNGLAYHHGNAAFTRHDGILLPVSLVMNPVLEDGVPRGAVLVFLDMSEPTHPKEVLRRVNENLEKRSHERAAESSGTDQTAEPTDSVVLEPRRNNPKVLRVLVAEDNLVSQKLMTGLLKRWGHTVVVVPTGNEALAAMERQPFDLLFMDVQMPVMNGLDATIAIRKRENATGRHTPIVALTSPTMKGERERCLRAGMDGYLCKPIHARQLNEAVRRLIPTAARPPSARDSRYITREILRVSDILDHEEVLSRLDGNQSLLAELVGLFLSDCPEMMADLHDAVNRRDPSALMNAAHRIKSAVGNFGAHLACQLTEQLEDMGCQGDLTGVDPAYRALTKEIERLQPALAALAKENIVCES